MTTYTDDEHLPLPLIRRMARSERHDLGRFVDPSDVLELRHRDPVALGAGALGPGHPATADVLGDDWFRAKIEPERPSWLPVDRGIRADDRLSPGFAGGLTGAAGALAFVGTVHGMAPAIVEGTLGAFASAHGLDTPLVFALAYGSAVAVGGGIGTSFAILTRNLRKWPALAFWALVFFVSLGMILLAATAERAGVNMTLARPVLLASAIFAVIVSFSLPIRRRR